MSFMRCMSSGVMFCIALGHLVDRLLHQLLAQLVHHLLEPSLRVGRLEVVRTELANLAGEVVGHQVEPHVAFGRGGAGRVGPPFVAAVLGIAQGVLDRRGAPRR